MSLNIQIDIRRFGNEATMSCCYLSTTSIRSVRDFARVTKSPACRRKCSRVRRYNWPAMFVNYATLSTHIDPRRQRYDYMIFSWRTWGGPLHGAGTVSDEKSAEHLSSPAKEFLLRREWLLYAKPSSSVVANRLVPLIVGISRDQLRYGLKSRRIRAHCDSGPRLPNIQWFQ